MFRIKQEPDAEETTSNYIETDESDSRVIRKTAVLNPLREKLLGRQSHGSEQSDLPEKEKAKPPATFTLVPTPTMAATPDAAAVLADTTLPSQNVEEAGVVAPQTEKPLVIPPKTGGGSFRRKKVVPVAIARKMAKQEKSNPVPVVPQETTSETLAESLSVQSVAISESQIQLPSAQPTEEVKSNSVPSTQANNNLGIQTVANAVEKLQISSNPVPPVEEIAKEEESLRPATTAFRRIKPKVAINIGKSRPRKSILKKSDSSGDVQKGSNEPSKSLLASLSGTTIVLDDDDEDEEELQRIAAQQQKEKEEQEKLLKEEEERVLAARRLIEEEQRKAIEEEMRKIEERDRRLRLEQQNREQEDREKKENERRKAEEMEKLAIEARKKAAEARKKEVAENQKRMVKEQRQNDTTPQKHEEKGSSSEKSTSVKEACSKQLSNIAPEMRKLGCDQSFELRQESVVVEMKKNILEGCRLQPAVVQTSYDKEPEKQKCVNVEDTEQLPVQQNQPVAQKQIRRISRLPPTVALKLMSSVAKKQQPNPLDGNVPQQKEVGSAEKNEEASCPEAPGHNKAIRRISRLPPNLALRLVQSVKKGEVTKGKETGQQNQLNSSVQCLHEKADTPKEENPCRVEDTSIVKNMSPGRKEDTTTNKDAIPTEVVAPTKEVRPLARSIPAKVALELLGTLANRNKLLQQAKEQSTMTKRNDTDASQDLDNLPKTVNTATEVSPTSRGNFSCVTHPVTKGAGALVLQENLTPAEGITPKKEIRRIARVPPSLALKLLGSVVNRNKASRQTANEPAPPVSNDSNNVNTNTTLSTEEQKTDHLPATTAQGLVNPVISQQVETVGSSDNEAVKCCSAPESTAESSARQARNKVHILSQVILPSASYNLEELLAGKSTENVQSMPSGPVTLPLPISRTREVQTKLETPISQDVCTNSAEEYIVVDSIAGQEPTIQQQQPQCDRQSPDSPSRESVTIGSEVTVETTEKQYEADECSDVNNESQSPPVDEYIVVDNVAGQEPHIEAVEKAIPIVATSEPHSSNPEICVPQLYEDSSVTTGNETQKQSYQAPPQERIDTEFPSGTQRLDEIPRHKPVRQSRIAPQSQRVTNTFPMTQPPHPQRLSDEYKQFSAFLQGLPASAAYLVPNNQFTFMPHLAAVSHQQRSLSHPLLVNPANIRPQQVDPQQQSIQRPTSFTPPQFVVLRHMPQPGSKINPHIAPQQQPQQLQQFPQVPMVVQRPPVQPGPVTCYPTIIATNHARPEVVVPTPRFLIAPSAMQTASRSVPRREFRTYPQTVHYTSLSNNNAVQQNNRAFQPVEPPPVTTVVRSNKDRVIPKIVVFDSSGVEQEQRRQPTEVRNVDSQKVPANFSPCSQDIKERLRQKIQANLKRKGKHCTAPVMPECKEVRPLPTVPIGPVAPNTKSVIQLAQPKAAAFIAKAMPEQKSRPEIYDPKVYPRNDLLHQPTQIVRLFPPHRSADEPRPIKQYIYGQGKKIYLTKISVTKPQTNAATAATTPNPLPVAPNQAADVPTDATSTAVKPPSACERDFYGFPQSSIKVEKRVCRRFRQAVEQFERKISPEPDDQQSNRQPSTITEVTTAGPEGRQMFIITEIDDAASKEETDLVVQSEVSKEQTDSVLRPEASKGELESTAVKQEVTVLPKITVRRKTFVVDDSDCEISVEQLPRISESSQGSPGREVSNDEENDNEKQTSEDEKEDQQRRIKIEEHNRPGPSILKNLKKEDYPDSESDRTDEDLAREILALVEKERRSLRMDSPAEYVRKVKRRRKKRKRPRIKQENDNSALVDLLMKHVNQESLIADIIATQRKEIIELSDSDEQEEHESLMWNIKEEQWEAPVSGPASEDSDGQGSTKDTDVIEIDEETDDDIIAEILKPFLPNHATNDKCEDEQLDAIKNETSNPMRTVTETAMESMELADQISHISNSAPGGEPKEERAIEAIAVIESQEVAKVSRTSALQPAVEPVTNTPEDISAQTCDKDSALPEQPKAVSAAAQKAPKRRIKPALVSRSKDRKLVTPKSETTILFDELKEPLDQTQNKSKSQNLNNVPDQSQLATPGINSCDENSSEPFSDREAPIEEEVSEKGSFESVNAAVSKILEQWPSGASAVEVFQSITRAKIAKEITDEWDSEEPSEGAPRNPRHDKAAETSAEVANSETQSITVPQAKEHAEELSDPVLPKVNNACHKLRKPSEKTVTTSTVVSYALEAPAAISLSKHSSIPARKRVSVLKADLSALTQFINDMPHTEELSTDKQMAFTKPQTSGKLTSISKRRVSVLRLGLMKTIEQDTTLEQRSSETPDPISSPVQIHNSELITPPTVTDTRAPSTQESPNSVKQLLQDWEDSPVKDRPICAEPAELHNVKKSFQWADTTELVQEQQPSGCIDTANVLPSVSEVDRTQASPEGVASDELKRSPLQENCESAVDKSQIPNSLMSSTQNPVSGIGNLMAVDNSIELQDNLSVEKTSLSNTKNSETAPGEHLESKEVLSDLPQESISSNDREMADGIAESSAVATDTIQGVATVKGTVKATGQIQKLNADCFATAQKPIINDEEDTEITVDSAGVSQESETKESNKANETETPKRTDKPFQLNVEEQQLPATRKSTRQSNRSRRASPALSAPKTSNKKVSFLPESTEEKPPIKVTRSLRNRSKSVLIDQSPEKVKVFEEPQVPAGRVLRSRTKSVFVDKPTPRRARFDENVDKVVDEYPQESPQSSLGLTPQVLSESVPEQQQQPQQSSAEPVPERMESDDRKQVEAAGGSKLKQTKSSNKPTPPTFIYNRIPIPISSEDEDDAPLAKRRKVLRKRRSTARSHTVRDLNANRRLFQSAHKSISSTADDNFPPPQIAPDFIKTEPPDEIPETDELIEPYEPSFVTPPPPPKAPSGRRRRSTVTVHHTQGFIIEELNGSSTPRVKNEPFENTATPQAVHTAEEDDHIFATPEPIKKKRKRRTKAEIEADRIAKGVISSPVKEESSSEGEPTPKRSKRDSKPGLPVDLDNIPLSVTEFECAACSKKIGRYEWDDHYRWHSGLTYRKEIDPEFDITDEPSAVHVVMRFMKTYRQLTLRCEKCDVAKKSALGLVSHRKSCGLSAEEIEKAKISCQHCGRKMQSFSMTIHLQSHCAVLKRKQRERDWLEASQANNSDQGKGGTVELTQRGSVKRRATCRAEKRIQCITLDEMIVTVTKHSITEGCLAAWKTQLRKAKVAKCVFETCDFAGSGEEEMRNHHLTCLRPCKLFECKSCRFQASKFEQVARHIKAKHMDAVAAAGGAYDSSGTDAKFSSESSDDEGGSSGVDENENPDGSSFSEEDNALKLQRSSRKLYKPMDSLQITEKEIMNDESDVYREMILDEVLEVRALKSAFHVAVRGWEKEFRELNYSLELLFPELRPNVDDQFLTSYNTLHEYIPKGAKSVRFAMRFTNLYNAPVEASEYQDKWQQLDVFSGIAKGTDSLFYCGGPVITLDWMPMPDGVSKKEHQILAVACKSDFDEFHLADRILSPTKCLIQIWDLGYLHNESLHKKAENSVPKLLYSIACDFGPIWTLKFCPSGCFNDFVSEDGLDRMGLLAATGSDGDIRIYCLTRNYEPYITNRHNILTLKPVLRLSLTVTETSANPQYEGHGAVKLAWSKGRGHAVIAAGYSNGVVAVWNLNTKSALLTGTKAGIRVLLPVNRMYIPDSCITALDLHYAQDSRYLLVCNADRKILIYDLQTGYLPVEVCYVNARSKVTGACWNVHFPIISLVFDDVYAIDRCALTLHQPREIGVKLSPLYTFSAEATDVSANEWLSNHLVGTDGGDVLCHLPMAYLHQISHKNLAQIKYVLTSTTSVRTSGENTDTSYKMFNDNFGLLFSDNDKHTSKMDMRSLQVKNFRRALLHEYPGIRVNQTRWNPNEASFQYYAIGYQAGFVRVRGFRMH